jgi:CheY-like chemotaxis protein
MPTRKKLSVLLLDDRAEVVALYRRELERTGRFDVVPVTDGGKARQLAEGRLFDLIVIDAKLSYRGVEFGGLRLADELRPRYGSSSILVISGYIKGELVRERELDLEFMEKQDDSTGRRFGSAVTERLLTMRKRQYVFVAMPFAPKHANLYTRGIVPAVRAAGFQCYRVDEVAHNRGIQNVIFDLVRGSKLVVFIADDANPNAYYEAGFADAMRKEVVIVARALDELRFDIANRHAIFHGHVMKQFRESLTAKIAALRLTPTPGT